jgi:hypothetical protein
MPTRVSKAICPFCFHGDSLVLHGKEHSFAMRFAPERQMRS